MNYGNKIFKIISISLLTCISIIVVLCCIMMISGCSMTTYDSRPYPHHRQIIYHHYPNPPMVQQPYVIEHRPYKPPIIIYDNRNIPPKPYRNYNHSYNYTPHRMPPNPYR